MVHNGIVTNYKDIRVYLSQRGHEFESDTDTEVIAKLVKHIYHSTEENQVGKKSKCINCIITLESGVPGAGGADLPTAGGSLRSGV